MHLIPTFFRYSLSFKSQGSPVKRGILVNTTPFLHSPSSLTFLPVSVQFVEFFNFCSALVDSAAEGNFMDGSIAGLWGINAIPFPDLIPAR